MKKIILLILMCMIFSSFVFGSDLIFKQDEKVDIKIPCALSGGYCSSNTNCNATIRYPNGSYMIKLIAASYNYTNGDVNVTLRNSRTPGEYSGRVTCIDRGNNGTKNFNFKITYSGEESTISDSLLYGITIFVLLLFLTFCSIGFSKYKTLPLRTLLGGAIYLQVIALSYILWITTENIIFTTSFLPKIFYWILIVLMILAFPLLLGILTLFMWYMITVKPIKDMLNNGVPEDRALAKYGRKERRRGNL